MLARTLFRFVLTLALSMVAVGAAWAHAQLLASAPADGSLAMAEPDVLTLTFNEPVGVLALKLVAPDGAIQPLAGVAPGSVIHASLPRGLPPGTRLVSYRVMSADGHPVGGTIAYAVGERGANPDLGLIDATSPGLAGALVASRWLGLMMLALAVGGATLAWGLALPVPRRLLRVAAGLGVPALLVWLQATGADMGAAFFSLDATLLAIASPAARTIAAHILALGLAVLSVRREGQAVLAPVALALSGLGFALSGHAASASPHILMRPLVALHGMIALLWVGALPPLLLLIRRERTVALAGLARFSRAAVPGVLVLLASGTVLALVQVEDGPSLTATAYGRLLVAKLLLVAVVLGIAALNRVWLTPLLGSGRPRPLRGVLGLDMFAMAVLLALVAAWRLTPPPRALHAADLAGISAHVHGAEAMADITLVPGRNGVNAVDLSVLSGDFGPMPAKELRLTFTDPAARHEPVTVAAHLDPDARWRVPAVNLPFSGRYQLKLDLLVDDFTMKAIEGDVTLRH